MLLRKIVGFCVGFLLSFGAIVATCVAMRVVIHGPAPIFVSIAIGLVTSRIFVDPQRLTMPIRGLWWAAEPGLRLCLLLSVVWMVLAYVFQDRWWTDYQIILLPPLALLALYFGYRYLVRGADTD